MPVTATRKLRSWKGIDKFFSYYDMSEYDSGMTSPGDRKQQDKSTDIMICQADVSPVCTATLGFTHM